MTQLGFKPWDYSDVGPRSRAGVGPQSSAAPPLMPGDSAVVCTLGSCFAQLPVLCGSQQALPPAVSAHLQALCSNSSEGFPYSYDYNPAETSRAELAAVFEDAHPPPNFTRALIAGTFAAMAAESGPDGVDGSGFHSWETAPQWLQVRVARRWAAHMYLLAADSGLDVSSRIDNSIPVDSIVSVLLNRTTVSWQQPLTDLRRCKCTPFSKLRCDRRPTSSPGSAGKPASFSPRC